MNYKYGQLIIMLMSAYTQNIYPSQNVVEAPVINLEMYPVNICSVQQCKKCHWWKALNIEKTHEICSLPYDDNGQLVQMHMREQKADGSLNNKRFDHNFRSLQQAIIEQHKQKGLPIEDPALMEKLMQPQLPEWISLSAVQHLKHGDTLEFMVHGCKVKAKINLALDNSTGEVRLVMQDIDLKNIFREHIEEGEENLLESIHDMMRNKIAVFSAILIAGGVGSYMVASLFL